MDEQRDRSTMNRASFHRIVSTFVLFLFMSTSWSVDVADPGLSKQIAGMEATSVRAWLVDIGWLRGEAGKEWIDYAVLAEASDALIVAVRQNVDPQERMLAFGLNATGLTLSRIAERMAYRNRLYREGRLLEAIRLCANMAGKVHLPEAGEGYSPEDIVRVRNDMLSGGPLPVGATAKQRAQLERLRLYAGAVFGIARLNSEEADLLMREMGGYSTTTYDSDGMRELRAERFAHLDATCLSALAMVLASGNAQQRGSAAQIRRMPPADP